MESPSKLPEVKKVKVWNLECDHQPPVTQHYGKNVNNLEGIGHYNGIGGVGGMARFGR